MSNKIRFCLLCGQHDGRIKRIGYTKISTVEREEKLREGYRRRYNGQEIDQPILNQYVHKKCYNKTVEYIPSIDASTSHEQTDDDDEEQEQDQTSVVQSRSCATLPANVKSLLERSKRACIVCHSYKYSHTNRLKQVGSNAMAKKLAEGFLRRYKRPYGKSLLDAYIHATCYRKLYGSYRYQSLRSSNDTNDSQYQTPMINRTDLNESISLGFRNINLEFSAKSDLFRPCLQRLSPEEIKLYTKRDSTSKETDKDTSEPRITNNCSLDYQLPPLQSSISFDFNDQDEQLPVHSTFNNQPKISKTAEIRYRSSQLTDHDYTSNIQPEKSVDELDQLHDWLIDQLKSSEYPIHISEVLKKYQELTKEEVDPKKPERLCRIRLRNRLEKFYPNKFLFVVPNKHDGTFIALNDIDHYLRFSIKRAQKDKEVIVPPVVIPPTPKDYQRETCEAVMNGIRKIRLYIRDGKQINYSPSIFMQNLIGLITVGEKQFERISHDYDFYRMIDENLFENNQENSSNKIVRNMSLASDIISARHDRHISQKHYLLADEIAKETFHCTPRQVITLLNRYGHTCSYKSYRKMKKSIQQSINELGEGLLLDDERSWDDELDLMEL